MKLKLPVTVVFLVGLLLGVLVLLIVSVSSNPGVKFATELNQLILVCLRTRKKAWFITNKARFLVNQGLLLLHNFTSIMLNVTQLSTLYGMVTSSAGKCGVGS